MAEAPGNHSLDGNRERLRDAPASVPARGRTHPGGLAERAGLSANGLGALERGDRQRPRRETIELLVEALSLPPADRAALAAAARGGLRLAGGATTKLPVALDLGAPPDSPLIGRAEDLDRFRSIPGQCMTRAAISCCSVERQAPERRDSCRRLPSRRTSVDLRWGRSQVGFNFSRPIRYLSARRTRPVRCRAGQCSR